MLKSLKAQQYIVVIFAILGAIVVGALIIQFCRSESPQVYYSEGLAYLKNGEYDKAISRFDKAIQLNPMEFYAYDGRGIANTKKKRLDEAIRDFTKAIQLNPNLKDVYYNRAIAYFNKMDFDKAISDYNQAVRFDRSDYLLYNSRGLAFFEKMDLDKAIKDYTEAIQLNPNFENAYFNRGLVYHRKKDFDSAIKDYTSALEINPNNGDVYEYRAMCYYRKARWKSAMDDFENAIRLNSKDEVAYNNYAWLLATCPNFSIRNGMKSIELAKNACELTDWKKWNYLSTLAACYAETGNFNQAIKYQTQALNMEGVSETDRSEAQKELNLYQQGKPYCEMPMTNSLSPTNNHN